MINDCVSFWVLCSVENIIYIENNTLGKKVLGHLKDCGNEKFLMY